MIGKRWAQMWFAAKCAWEYGSADTTMIFINTDMARNADPAALLKLLKDTIDNAPKD